MTQLPDYTPPPSLIAHLQAVASKQAISDKAQAWLERVADPAIQPVTLIELLNDSIPPLAIISFLQRPTQRQKATEEEAAWLERVEKVRTDEAIPELDVHDTATGLL